MFSGNERSSADLGDVFNPLDPDFIRDPYSRYKMLREIEPVHRTATGIWVLTRYDDVAAGLMDARLSNRPAPFAVVSPRNKDRHLAAAVANRLIAFLDPPEHTPPRKSIAKTFVAHLKGKEPMIRRAAEELLAGIGPGDFDFVRDFATPYAVRCICGVMGFPEQDAPRLKHWSGVFFYLFHSIPDAATLEAVNRALEEFRAYVGDHLARRRIAPGDDLVSRLLEQSGTAGPLEEDELIDNIMLLTADGIENVHTGLASAVAIMLGNRDQLELAVERPELFPAAVDECLRYESPGQYQGRIARETLEIGGITIRANSVVLLVLASANRDPDAFPDPDSFLIERKGRRHLAFGAGRHACIGGALVNIEFAAFFEAYAGLWNRTRPAAGDIAWTARAGHRWPAALPLTIHPANR
jgi:pimeloyl-[acyl-carrier protein] synthase